MKFNANIDLSECLTEGGSVGVSSLLKSEEKELDILFQKSVSWKSIESSISKYTLGSNYP